MPIFISYSHQNKDFATRLGLQLVKHNTHVWIDDWELKVGDSILDRIQEAIQSASALLVILSKASVESEWCKKELSSGLLRELEEKRVVVLPLLLEDCEIPLFLRGKKYADFRTDFDTGLHSVITAVAHLTSDRSGRHRVSGTNVDWSLDWGFLANHFFLQINLVETTPGLPFTTLTELQIVGNNTVSKRYELLIKQGIDWIQRTAVICQLGGTEFNEKLRMLIADNQPVEKRILFKDSQSDGEMTIVVTSRRLGEDTGNDIVIDIAAQLRNMCAALRASQRKPTEEELKNLQAVHNSLKTYKL